MGLFFNPPPLPELRPDPVANQGAFNDLKAIQFQFTPQGITRSEGAVWASQAAQNRENPILQFSRSQQGSVTFEAKLFAETTSDDIDEKIRDLIVSQSRDPSLRRPFVWIFTWGNVIEERVVIDSVSNIRYDEIRPDGTARGILCTITLLRYVPHDIILTDPSAPIPSTFFVFARDGDQWEDVALREYREPLFGDILRQQNPDILVPGDEPGAALALPPIEVIRNEPFGPTSVPLRRTEEGLERRTEMFRLRGRSKETTILKQDV